MSPGLPIMKFSDLVNWKVIGYAYNRLADNDALTLQNGQNTYGRGSWASSLRYHNGTFYASTFSTSTGKTHMSSPRAEGAVVVEAFAKAQVRDIITRDGMAYVLSGKLREAKVRSGINLDETIPAFYNGEVFSSRDLKSWTRHASFEAKALPNALEIASEGNSTVFYVGLSSEDYREHPVAAGNILKLMP
jgi:beta-xylosidase